MGMDTKRTPLTASARTRALALGLAVCLAWSTSACSDPPMPFDDPALAAFLDDTSGPPEPRPLDTFMRMKADVIALPAISVTVWALGALMVYIGGQQVFNNTISDFEAVLNAALGQSADWSWAEQYDEPLSQADHLTDSLALVSYRSEDSDFYAVTGNDYLRFLTMVSPTTIIDPGKLRELLDGKIRPWGRFAREYFAALQVASVQARHLSDEQVGQGLCVRATVHSIGESPTPYVGLARARGHIDVIPAAVLASLRATMRCGMYDTGVREYVYSFYKVSGSRGTLMDIFISHTLKSAKLLHKYVDVCQMPPKVEVTFDTGDCHDVTLH